LSFEDWRAGMAETTAEPVEDPFAEETLERIKGDSFYGQTHISLPEIEKRLAETEATVGSPDEIRAFVFSGLSRFGCPVNENADGSWRIVLTEPALQTASVGEVIERATFDPEWALDDPDVTLLDVGHPLVRRLIEETKQHTFRVGVGPPTGTGGDSPHYGRTAYVVTPDVEEVTALFHLLARYVVNTEPTSIVEELLPVAVPVYGGEPLGRAATQRLLRVRPSAETRTELEAREALADALRIETLERLFIDAVEARRLALAAERRSMKQQMEGREGVQAAEWLQGIDELLPGSMDLLAITVLFPGWATE
jgi:hypothetical protein